MLPCFALFMNEDIGERRRGVADIGFASEGMKDRLNEPVYCLGLIFQIRLSDHIDRIGQLIVAYIAVECRRLNVRMPLSGQ